MRPTEIELGSSTQVEVQYFDQPEVLYAFGVPLHYLFYEGDEPPPLPKLTPRKTLEELAKAPGKKGAEAKFLLKLEKLLSKVKERDRAVFLATAQQLAAVKR